MRRYTKMSSGSRFRGHGAAGHETTAFDRALKSVYDTARGVSTPEPRWVLNPRNGHRVGTVNRQNGVLVFERRVTESRHRLKMFGGAWALEVPLLAKLESWGVSWERIITDTGRALYVPLALYRERGKTISYAGYGVQLVLPESWYTSTIADGFEESRQEPNPPVVNKPPAQPCLFTEGGL